MKWEELTSTEFLQATIKADGVCIIPLGCLERHGDHLPLGTDIFIARELCNRAALIEPVIVFPDIYLTQIFEAKHCLGTIAVSHNLFFDMLNAVCHEIARNGLKKIILLNAHGGNNSFLQFFCQCQLADQKDFVVYLAKPKLDDQDKENIKKQWDSQVDGHGGENETSIILSIRPELAKKDLINGLTNEGIPKKRLKEISDAGLYTGIWWYGDHPTHYCGQAEYATEAKGNNILDAKVRSLVNSIRAVKEDSKTSLLQSEFFELSKNPKSFSTDSHTELKK